MTDAHVLDASSPARVTFLDRLGAPFESTFRPQEALTVQVLAGAARSVRALRPQFVIQGGDVIDNDQSNELSQALAVLSGRTVDPGSGPHGYFGVQLAGNPDPFYYRPDVDAPRYPGLLRAATRTFTEPRPRRPVHTPCSGDHDVLVAGGVVPTELTRSAGRRRPGAVGAAARVRRCHRVSARMRAASPDGPPDPGLVDSVPEAGARRADGDACPPTQRGGRWPFTEVVGRLRGAAGPGMVGARQTPAPARLDYTLDLGPRLRLIVLDLVRRGGGSGGVVASGQAAWLAERSPGPAGAG